IPSKTISESSNFDQLIRVQQPEGCAEPGDVIEVDMTLLDQFGEGGMNHGPSEGDKRAPLGDEDENAITKIGQDLVTSWARYRWGVFGGLNPNWPNKSNSVEEVKDLSRNWTSNCVNETRNCSSEEITNFATSKSQTYSNAEPDEDFDNRQASSLPKVCLGNYRKPQGFFGNFGNCNTSQFRSFRNFKK
ncbi:hypothetical protein Anas_01636, partial [Armadillidium nasatum]